MGLNGGGFSDKRKSTSQFREKLNNFLFNTETLQGRVTNFLMLGVIITAVFLSMLSTVPSIQSGWGDFIDRVEFWVLILFTVEYGCRIYAAHNRWQYIKSFNGIVDLITILPLLLTGDSIVLVRLLRLARVIRVAVSFPVVRALFLSLKGSIKLLMGVLGTIFLISVLVGNAIFILEPQTFANAFEGTWWSLVTMSTVGYGDFVPKSVLGKSLAATLIMAGICMFAMVTAVISVKVGRMVNYMKLCAGCRHSISPDYKYCPHCALAQKFCSQNLGENNDVCI